MDITQASILHHIAIVLVILWALSASGWSNPLIFFVSFVYICLVEEKIEFEERRKAYQQRVLSDSESVRWLNHALEKIWLVCVEQVATQKFLLPVIPWFLEKYKPWPASKVAFEHLYLGRNPPVFTTIRVLGESASDDDLVLELGMSFLSAEDMNGILAIQIRKRLGLGIWTKAHVLGMHVEGKVLVGVKFIKEFPYIKRIRVCFVEPPYFNMTVKPIFSHGVDVTEVPGIAGYIEKILDVVFEQTLVEPNMLVIDVEKFVSAPSEKWFDIDEKHPVAFVKVEIMEGAELKPSDMNGLADPYVKGQLGSYRFQTKTIGRTLAPKWMEDFNVPLTSWDAQNVLVLEVCDKNRMTTDDMLGTCSINVSELRGGQKHDMWLPLKNTNTGKLHVALTIVESDNVKMEQSFDGSKSSKKSDSGIPERNLKDQMHGKRESETPSRNSTSENYFNDNAKTEDVQNISDHYEPVDMEGQEKNVLWVHHPGSEVSPTWEPRKGHDRHPETQVEGEDKESNLSPSSPRSASSGSDDSNISQTHESGGHHKSKKLGNNIKKGFEKVGLFFGKNFNNKSPGGRGEAGYSLVHSPTNTDERVSPPLGDKLKKVKLVMNDESVNNSGTAADNCNREKDREEKVNKDDTRNSATNSAVKDNKVASGDDMPGKTVEDGLFDKSEGNSSKAIDEAHNDPPPVGVAVDGIPL